MQRNAISGRIVDVNTVQTIHFIPESPIGLELDFVDLRSDIDVVDIGGCKIRLQRAVHRTDGDAQHLRLLTINVQVQMRRICRIATERIEEFRSLHDLPH